LNSIYYLNTLVVHNSVC